MKKFSLFFVFTLLLINPLFGQDTVKIASYNLLNYPGSDTTTRNPYFRTVIEAIQPDILVVEEITSRYGMLGFLSNVMNAFDGSTYDAGYYVNSTDSERACFYDSTKFEFLANTAHTTSLRDINEFILLHKLSGDTLHIFTVHLKAGNGSTERQRREQEVAVLRSVTNTYHDSTYFLAAGDFNFYGDTEPGYQLITEDQTGNTGELYDPLILPGTWNTQTYSPYHTQSTRVRQFGGGSTSGLDDRFDIIFHSSAIENPGGVDLVPGSYWAFGNDTQHYNDSINRIPNTAVSQDVADALHYATDHLPIIASYVFHHTIVGNTDDELIQPEAYVLQQNYPNPFNPSTTIEFSIPETANVTLKVYDMLGREVALLVNERKTAGNYTVTFDAGDLASGLYIYTLQSSNFIQTKKMLLLR